jgi:hypothetical protein
MGVRLMTTQARKDRVQVFSMYRPDSHIAVRSGGAPVRLFLDCPRDTSAVQDTTTRE